MSKIVSDESLRRALSALAPSLPKRCDGAQRAACLAGSADEEYDLDGHSAK
ncbi:hypothetical protein [Nitrosomonas sp. Nm132]|uniref:hypothetical protein n=1 Tax=Nitrosomonas sp. Nm132 TaxID=1881053 RepID=UPI002109F4D3|nr:hypothetical protein [Nitrosomonas sp. Nm132]